MDVIWFNMHVQAESLRAGHPRSCPDSFWISIFKDRYLHNLSGQPVPMLSHRKGEKVFLDILNEPPLFQCVPIVSVPVTGHHWNVLAPFSLHSTFRYLCALMRSEGTI